MNKLVISIVALFSVALVAYAEPKFVIVGGDKYSWGDVRPKDSPLKAEIKLVNEGNETLLIKNVRPSCGCTAAPLDKNELAPGESTLMRLEFRVSGDAGVTSKSITIETNDPNRSKVYYEISANVVRDIICKPSNYMPFKDLKVGTEGTSTIFLKNNSKESITFSDLKIEPEVGIKLTIPATFTLEPNKEVEITGRIMRNELGYFNSKIIMKTSHPEYPTFEIPAYGNVAESPIFNNPEKENKGATGNKK
jgi:hypothetical protein